MTMKHVSIFLIIMLAIMPTVFIHAQSDSTKNHVMLVPQYLILNGVRIDYERKLTKTQWLQVCPMIYLGQKTKKSDNYDYDNLVGIGGAVYHKLYSNSTGNGTGAYLSYGLMANYFLIEYPSTTKVNKTDFAKVGGDVIIGYDYAVSRLLIGAWMGLGYRYTFTENKHIIKNFSDFAIDYAYSGNILNMGVKIGILF